jgi:hypothetical protein
MRGWGFFGEITPAEIYFRVSFLACDTYLVILHLIYRHDIPHNTLPTRLGHRQLCKMEHLLVSHRRERLRQRLRVIQRRFSIAKLFNILRRTSHRPSRLTNDGDHHERTERWEGGGRIPSCTEERRELKGRHGLDGSRRPPSSYRR